MAYFPYSDSFWNDVASFLKTRIFPDDRILAPNEFGQVFHQVYSYEVAYALKDIRFSFVIIHKGMIDRFTKEQMKNLLLEGKPVFANEVFVVLAFRPVETDYVADVHYDALLFESQKLPSGTIENQSWHETIELVAKQVEAFLQLYSVDKELLLVPFHMQRLFSQSIAYQGARSFRAEDFEWVVLFPEHRLLDHEYFCYYLENYTPVLQCLSATLFARVVRDGMAPLPDEIVSHLCSGLNERDLDESSSPGASKVQTAILMTSYNRPESLARSLPQVAALGFPVLVVDDASDQEHQAEIRRLCDAHRAKLLVMPENRGLPNALNAGISYWLAAPEIEWVSYFQDDVDISPSVIQEIEKVQDAERFPILSGRLCDLHPQYGEELINGTRVVKARSIPGIHIHAHCEYWRNVLPIPTPYEGAPKRRAMGLEQGADEDFWISAWSPHSITKQGGYVLCIPGLVRTFSYLPEHSTWGARLEKEDPPLIT